MASNESYRMTPATIVDGNTFFRIPLYQRLFAWRVQEVKQLMEDLHDHFSITQHKPYYIGMITVVHQGERLDLIDGQQRTTVMILLAIGFMQTLPQGEEKENWEKFFGSSDRVFFNGRSQDREFLRALAEERPSTYKNDHMEEALSFIKTFLKDKFDEMHLQQFADAVFKHLTLFVTELPNHYVENPSSLNEYFEAMNSSGKSLEQHEILKVELLRKYDKADKLNLTRLWNVVSNFEQPIIKLRDMSDAEKIQCESYKSYIRLCKRGDFEKIYNDFCEKSKDEGTRKTIAEIEVKKYDFNNKPKHDKEKGIISFPEFLLLVLALHTENVEFASIHPSKLHDTFKNNPIPQEEIETFYHELFMYRLLMDLYVVRLKYSSSSSSHQLIFNNQEETDSREHAHNRLRQFQSMLDASTEPHIWMLPLLKHLKELNHEPTQMELLKFLMIKDFNRRNHSCIPAADKLDYDSKPRYWLWRLEYALWEKLVLEGKAAFGYDALDAEAIRVYEFHGNNRSIEHLHPQNENNNEEWPRKDIDSFGNLALISSGFNSQQSNLTVHVKFANLEVLIGNKNLQSIKLYFMYLKAKKNEAEWTTIAKNEHAKDMLEILKESLDKVKSYEEQSYENGET